MSTQKHKRENDLQPHMPSLETIQAELGKAESMDDFFGKEGIFARLFAETLEQMLEAELSAELGYEPYEAKGRNTGNCSRLLPAWSITTTTSATMNPWTT
jgi:hypothetical protein